MKIVNVKFKENGPEYSYLFDGEIKPGDTAVVQVKDHVKHAIVIKAYEAKEIMFVEAPPV